MNSPRPHQLGVVDDLLVDRAFVDDADNDAVELATLADVTVPGPHNVANALAAAALARAFGVAPAAVAEGLRDVHARRRTASPTSRSIDGVRFVDDSKATNPHAAAASLHVFDSIVWIAGGLGKGIAFDEVVRGAAARLRGCRVIGARRHESPTHSRDTRPMSAWSRSPGPRLTSGSRHGSRRRAGGRVGGPRRHRAARAGRRVHGHVRDYAHRGDVFAAAVARYRDQLTSAR